MRPLVKISLEGLNIEQIINKLNNSNIKCYNILKPSHKSLIFSIDFKNLKKIKPLLKNYQYKITYLGLANLKTWLIKNLAIFLVLPFALSLMAFSSRITWKIEIYGAEGNLKQEVISTLKQNNIQVGKSLPKDNQQMEKLLMENLNNVAQVSCVIRGTSLIINISPKLVYVVEEHKPILASFNGIVESISLVSGTLAVNIGDFVNKGEILVYPFTLNKNNEQVPVKPIAEIRAKAYIVGSTKLNATSTKLVETGRTYTTFCINIFNKNLFSKNWQKPFAIYRTYVYNENISSVLPIKRKKCVFYEMEYVLVNYDLEQERAGLEQQSVTLAYQNLPTNSEILEQKTSSVIVNDCLYVATTLTISTIIS